MINAIIGRRTLIVSSICASIAWLLHACISKGAGPSAAVLRTPEGLAQWQQREGILQDHVQAASVRYKQEASLKALKGYESTVRERLDHGFALYRAHRGTVIAMPADLVPSLEQQTNLLMDIADEFIKHGSLVVGESIASDVVHHYADLPTMTPAQRRAEAVLMRYRYRQDY